MNKQDTDIDLESLVFWDEPKCTGRHNKPETQECGIEVTHYRETCDLSGPVCAVTASYIFRALALPRGQCGNCHKSIHECWKIRPI